MLTSTLIAISIFALLVSFTGYIYQFWATHLTIKSFI